MAKVINITQYKEDQLREQYIKQCIAYYGYSKEQQAQDKQDNEG